MKSGRVFRGALWIIGEYALDIPANEEPTEEPKKESAKSSAPSRRVLADGTYATESAFSASVAQSKIDAVKSNANRPPLRNLILNGDFFVASALASALTKLVLRYGELGAPDRARNSLRSEAMLIMTSIVRVGRSEFVTARIDEDSAERVTACIRILSGTYGHSLDPVFLADTRRAFAQLVEVERASVAKAKSKTRKATVASHADDLITFRHLKSKRAVGDVSDEYDLDLTRATGAADKGSDLASKLNRVVQLTGFSDPVYAEAYVTVHQFDILMDILIVNQTSDTLQNLTVEFTTMGDLKLAERPTPYTIGPHGYHSVKANIKVSSTETGIIFGNIVYDGPSAVDMNCVILNDIHVDIMDYIKPSTCTEQQ
ncbi:coatomer subunit beta, partial [Cladochytrium tenue]